MLAIQGHIIYGLDGMGKLLIVVSIRCSDGGERIEREGNALFWFFETESQNLHLFKVYKHSTVAEDGLNF